MITHANENTSKWTQNDHIQMIVLEQSPNKDRLCRSVQPAVRSIAIPNWATIGVQPEFPDLPARHNRLRLAFKFPHLVSLLSVQKSSGNCLNFFKLVSLLICPGKQKKQFSEEAPGSPNCTLSLYNRSVLLFWLRSPIVALSMRSSGCFRSSGCVRSSWCFRSSWCVRTSAFDRLDACGRLDTFDGLDAFDRLDATGWMSSTGLMAESRQPFRSFDAITESVLGTCRSYCEPVPSPGDRRAPSLNGRMALKL